MVHLPFFDSVLTGRSFAPFSHSENRRPQYNPYEPMMVEVLEVTKVAMEVAMNKLLYRVFHVVVVKGQSDEVVY